MEVTWTQTALISLERERRYIAQDNPDAAERVRGAILAAAGRLGVAGLEEMGRPGRVDATRELIIKNTPYIIAYTLLDDRIRILALQHAAREWPRGF